MGFKEMVAQDVRKVFLNTDELAERRTIHYDEEEYLDLPVMLQDQELERRDRDEGDHMPGLHKASAVLYCAREGLGGRFPAVGDSLEISKREGGRFFERYSVAAASDQMGMLRIVLEATRR